MDSRMKVYSFPRGGITINDPAVPQNSPSVVAFLPAISVIPMVQHPGGRAYPIVSVGDLVREGMLIGRGQGSLSANVHASVPGRVIRMVSWKAAGGQNNDALIIRMEGSFEKLGKREEFFPWIGMSAFDLHRTIAEFGIVEMEGSGRPVADMLNSLRNQQGTISLVVRCVFDDPWLAADRLLCMERTKAIAQGAHIMCRAGRMGRIVFALSQGETELGSRLMEEASRWEIPISLVYTGSRYPQRNQRELELVLRSFGKKENVELGSLLMLGPATLAAIHDAVAYRKPILDRYVAVGGSAVRKPQVMKVRIGTRIGEIFAECGGFVDKPRKIASGSPVLGRAVVDLDEPVIKTSYAVFALLEAHAQPRRNCISCGECRTVCPVGLDPEELYKNARAAGRNGTASGKPGISGNDSCHGCGCCDVVCPSRLALSQTILGMA
ncbi:MAG: SLBB domain-containing protein [Treponema sp.]|jgi:electron transport complex protein RnfC|nr:SLBB domain-containing protein [Treponema sp.]